MEQLTAAMASKISLTRGEDNLVPLRTRVGSNLSPGYSLSLIGKVLVDKELSLTFIKNNVMRLLNPVKGVAIRILASNLFLIRFNYKVDRKNAMEGCLWSLDKHTLLFTKIDAPVPLAAHKVHWMRIVIRVHDFPCNDQSDEDAQAIGDNFGKFLGLLKTGGSAMPQFWRTKVLIDVSEPLKRGIFCTA